MNILLALIPVTLLIVVTAIGIFFWAVNHRQFDDLDSPGVLPLMEEDPAKPAQDNEAATTPADADTAPSAHRAERPEKT